MSSCWTCFFFLCWNDLVFLLVFICLSILEKVKQNPSALEQRNKFLHEKYWAQLPLEAISVWLGSYSLCRVTQSITSWACSLHSAFSLWYILESSSPACALSSWVLLWHTCLLSDRPTSFCPLKLSEMLKLQTPVSKGLPLSKSQGDTGHSAGRGQDAAPALNLLKINSRQQQMPHDISNPCCRSPMAACPICLSCASLCGFILPRFEGAGILQWHFWLPVPHFPFHGGPAGAAPGGGPAGLAGDDGGRWERGSALPGSRLNSGGSDWMAPKSNGTVSLSFTHVLCRAVRSSWVRFIKPNVQGIVSEVLLWGLRKAAAQYLVQWLMCSLMYTVPCFGEQKIFSKWSFVSEDWGKIFL